MNSGLQLAKKLKNSFKETSKVSFVEDLRKHAEIKRNQKFQLVFYGQMIFQWTQL